MADPDKHDLYELCAQSPERDVELLRAIHAYVERGRDSQPRVDADPPRVLAEDFAGTGAVSRRWVQAVPGGSAIATDHDAQTLARAEAPGVTTYASDVRTVSDPCDVSFVGNFSICEVHDRRALVDYLRHARTRLKPGGVMCCDLYGGADAFVTGELDEFHPLPAGLGGVTDDDGQHSTVLFTWEQRHAGPVSGRVINAMHFRLYTPGRDPETDGPERELLDAFVYDWRLWSITELRDAMTDAGFARTEVYPRLDHALAVDGSEPSEGIGDDVLVRPLDEDEPLDDAWFVFVVGRA